MAEDVPINPFSGSLHVQGVDSVEVPEEIKRYFEGKGMSLEFMREHYGYGKSLHVQPGGPSCSAGSCERTFLGAGMMNQPFDEAEMDQARTALLSHVPLMLWGLFNGLKKEGFTEAQAFELTTDYLRTAFAPTAHQEP